MDSITTAVMAVLPQLASDTLSDAVKSAYEGLKAVIRRKFGEAAPISKALTAAEADPSSEAQAGVLAEKVAAAKATDDQEVMQALKSLEEKLNAKGIGGRSITGGQQKGIIQSEVHGQSINQTFGKK